ncbi:MAG TPA: DUF4136 domain-containing protein [Alcaligenaceae bacterium]|nr:DUF4136 domain-containing protein [Alcaligenaceae bacterium]
MAIAGMVLSVLAACSSGPVIRTDVDPSADFAEFKTFAFMDPLGTSKPGYTTIFSERLMRATRVQMEWRGYVLDASKPDLLINFHANLSQRSDYVPPPPMPWGYGYMGFPAGGYYGYWGGYPMAMGPSVIQYTEGVLRIDLVDARRRQLVWEGVSTSIVDDLQSATSEQGVQSIVAAIFAKFPYRAGLGTKISPEK